MTQIKDITDEMVYDAIRRCEAAWKTGRLAFPYDLIDAPRNVVLGKMAKMVKQGKLDYGVSLRTAWIVEPNPFAPAPFKLGGPFPPPASDPLLQPRWAPNATADPARH